VAGARVRIDQVSRRYQGGGEQVWALRDVSLDVAPGEFLAVIGRSGSGKTTLLNLIAGLDRPSSGTIRVDDRDIGACSDDQLTQIRRHTIGFIFQSFGLLPLLSALENVELALRIAGAPRGERGRRAREVLELVGLAKRLNHRPYELSGGEQQRVAIARALANRPTLILADEPTGELDSMTALSIFALLRDIVRGEGVTLITSTHDRAVMDLAGRVEELADGRVVASDQRRLLEYVARRDGGTRVRQQIEAHATLAVDEAATPAAPSEPEPPAAWMRPASRDEGGVAPAPAAEAPARSTPPKELDPEAREREPVIETESAPEPEDEALRWAPPERRRRG
jgi:putative ABC transport system ATP-binding protein